MRARLGPPLLLAAATIVLYLPLWTGFPFSQGDDALEYALPFGAFVARAALEGWIPLWNPYLNAGASLFVQTPYMGPFHPLFALFLLLPPERAVALGFAIHLVLAALLAYGFARSLGIGRLGAFVAGFLWASASPLGVDWARGYLPNLVGKAYLPGLLWILERARRTGRIAGPLAAGGALLALAFLGGHLTEAPMLLAAFGVYALAATPRGLRRAAGLWTVAAGAPLLAAALAAAYHLPLYEAIQGSAWTGGREPLAEAIYRPWELLRFFAPGMERGDTLGLYVGVVPWLAAALGLRPLGARAIPIVASAAVAAALMPGDAGGLYALARRWIPLFDIVTYTSMFQAPVVLAVATLAGAGADRLRSGPLSMGTRHRLALAALAMAAMNAGLGWALHGGAGGVPFRTRLLAEWNVSVPVLYTALLVFFLLLHLLAGRPRALGLVAALCCALDLTVYESVLLAGARSDPTPYMTPLSLPEIRGRVPPDRRLFAYEILRTEDRWRLRRNQGMVDRIPEVAVSAKVTDERYAWVAARFTEAALDREVIAAQNAAEGVPLVPRPGRLDWDALPDRAWLEILGVRYVLTDLSVYGDRVLLLEDGGDWGLYEVPGAHRDVLPLRPAPLPSRPGDLLDPAVAARDWWPDGERLVEGPEPCPDAQADVLDLRVEERGPNGYDYEAEAARGGLLALPIRYAPGWRAYLDGVRAPLYVHDLLFLGVNLPEGRHALSLRFDPLSFRLGLLLTTLGLTAAALLPLSARLVRADARRRRARA